MMDFFIDYRSTHAPGLSGRRGAGLTTKRLALARLCLSPNYGCGQYVSTAQLRPVIGHECEQISPPIDLDSLQTSSL